MKKILLSLLVAGLSTSASATYRSMMFQTSSGVSHYLDLESLTIVFTDDTLTATNSTETISIPLADMISMEFSETAGIESITSDRNTMTVAVYLPSGTYCGSFAFLAEAKDNLEKGIYVIRYTDGTSIKLAKK